MESTGARLKKIRLEKGVSLEEAHKKTKVHLNILKAIEEDSLVNLSPIYTKGFLKIYCKFLGVNPADFIKDYKEPGDRMKAHFDLGKAKRTEPFFSRMAFKFDAFKIRITPRAVAVSGIIIILLFIMFKVPKMISAMHNYFSSKAALTAVTPPAKAQGGIQQAPVQKAQAVTVIRLGIRVRDNCLVKVRGDGHVLMDRIFRKGMSDSWTAKEKIELSLSNAGVAELEINGKRVPALGRKGQAIKNIVITKEGWSIPR